MHLASVESKFLTLKDVAINTTALSGTRRDTSVKTTSVELLSDMGIDDTVLSTAGLLGSSVAGNLSRLLGGLLAEMNAVMLLIPLTEGSRVDLHPLDPIIHQNDQQTWMIAPLTRVLVRTSSLEVAL